MNFYHFSFFVNQKVEPEKEVLEGNEIVLISNPLAALRLLRNFGFMIRNLGINFSFVNAKIRTEFENYLDRYCSHSLQRFSLICSRFKVPFDNLKKPFKNVLALKIHTGIHQTVNHIRFLNETIFPNVNRIIIYDGASTLQHPEQKIHYENIEYFTLISHKMLHYPFSFSNLKHITVQNYKMELTDELCELVGSFEHLQTLKIWSFSFTTSDKFHKLLQLQNIQKSIVEMQIEFNEGIASDEIVRFLNKTHKLRKLSFHECNVYESGYHDMTSFFETLSTQLRAEWNIHSIYPYKNPFETPLTSKCYVIEKKVH